MNNKTSKKITYPKCPYCGNIYTEAPGYGGVDLFDLVRYASRTEAKVKCRNCNNMFKVKVHITYYASKI